MPPEFGAAVFALGALVLFLAFTTWTCARVAWRYREAWLREVEMRKAREARRNGSWRWPKTPAD